MTQSREQKKASRQSLTYFTECLRWCLGLQSYDEIKGQTKIREKRRQRRKGASCKRTPTLSEETP